MNKFIDSFEGMICIDAFVCQYVWFLNSEIPKSLTFIIDMKASILLLRHLINLYGLVVEAC